MIQKTNIYFDYNATTPLRKEARAAMLEVLDAPFNASSIHSFGRDAKKILTQSREKIAKAFGAEGASIVFTSSGTESNNMALVCIKDIEIVVTSEIEHVSISKPASFLNNRLIPVYENGTINLEKLQEICAELKGRKFLVSIIYANNETGIIQPIHKIAQIVFANGGFFHVDASQAAGKIPFDFNNCGADMATISAHKFGGAKGAAALIIKSGLEVLPFIHGGGQEKFLRAGTENLAAIAAMAAAAETAVEKQSQETKTIKEIRDFIEIEIKKANPNAVIFGQDVERLPNTILVACKGKNSETQLINFDLQGIAISAGAACSSGRVVTSHVLVAMGVDQSLAQCAIRISLGFNTTMAEAERFLESWSIVNSISLIDNNDELLTINAIR